MSEQFKFMQYKVHDYLILYFAVHAVLLQIPFWD